MHVEQIAGLLEQPPWASSPDESEPCYFRTWQRVSIALQKSFRQRASEIYFRDRARLRDLEPAYTLIVFSACRRYYGRPRCDFTYDVADPKTFHSAWRSLGNSLRTALAPIERRLREAGDFELAHRYAAVWHLDVLRTVKKRPRPFIRLIATEAKLVEAVIDLGTRRDRGAALRFHRIAVNTLCNFHGVDMTDLIPVLLEEATRVLSEARTRDFDSLRIARGLPGRGAYRLDHIFDSGIAKNGHARAAGSPDFGIGGQEDRYHRSSHGCGQMADSGIVAEVDARGREPAAELV
jgi:hypothetical protein